jgi:hypothetical protein
MGFFRSGEAPKPPEPKGMMQIFKNPAEQLTNSVASRIANYGTAVTVSLVRYTCHNDDAPEAHTLGTLRYVWKAR